MSVNQWDRHDNRHGTGAGIPLLADEMPKPAVFLWQMSMEIQLQGGFSRGEGSEPARLAGGIGLLCRQITVRAKTRGVVGSGRGGLGIEVRAGKQWWWIQGGGSRAVLFKRSKP